MLVPQRSTAVPKAGGGVVGVAFDDGVSGLTVPVTTLCAGEFGRLVMSEVLPALLPPFSWTAPTGAGRSFALELESVAAPPQAARKTATATTGIVILFIAIHITEGPRCD